MSINPDNITTIRVDQLAESTLNLTNEFPHSDGATLKKATIQSLVDLVATAVGSGSGVGFLPISVTDGQQLPNVPTDPSFFLCGPGTYLNINGYPNVVCTDELNAVMSLTDHWQLSVGIPITADLQSIGISQSVNDGVLDKAPSENAVYDFISQWLPKASLGYFDYADLATQTTPITVASGVETLLTNDTLGDDTNTSQPPYGVTAIWDADSDEFNFSQLSVGDTVDLRIHLKTTTTTANQKYHIDMKFAFDSPDEFENRIFSQYVKNASEDEQSFVTTLYIGSESVRTYPARLYITSDDDATVEVVGWFCRVFRKSVNIVDIITDEAPIDGLTYGRKDAEWVEVSGGGSVGTLQQVTDNGNTIVSGDFQANFEASAIEVTNQLTGTGTSIDATEGVVIKTGSFQGKIKTDNLTAVRTNQLPDKNITFAGIDDIPTELSELNDDSTHRLVTDTQISTWDGKQNTLTETNFGAFMNARTAKNTLVDADEVVSDDSADSNKAKKTTWLNVWTNYLKPKADALYQAILTDVTFGTFSTALTPKTTPVDADTVNLSDSADSNKSKKLSFANLKAWIFSLINTTITSETGVYYFNDLFGAMNTASDGFISTRASGLNSNVNFTTGTIPNHQVNQSGVAQLKTGTTATGVAGIHIGEPVYNSSLVVGGGVISYKTSINIETLSTVSERFWVGVGYKDGLFLNLGLANAICFIYDEGGVITGNTASPNWKIVTCNSSVRTFTDTGVAVSAGAWVKLEILINAAATSVEFFINNVSVGTISTNIPSGISKLMIINNQILKTIGTTSRNVYMDYVAYKQTFTTPRI